MRMVTPSRVRTVNDRVVADAMLRLRARDVLRKSQLHQFLPREGLLLDLGAGLGHISERVLQAAPARACIMIDPVNSVSMPVARRLLRFSCSAIKGSGSELPFPAGTFDGVWAAFVLHHVRFDGQQAILGEVRRVLRPGATFVLLEDTPSNSSELETTLRADRRINFEPDDAPHHYRSPDEWRNDLPLAGFSVERDIPFRRLFPPTTLHAVYHRAFVCRRQ